MLVERGAAQSRTDATPALDGHARDGHGLDRHARDGHGLHGHGFDGQGRDGDGRTADGRNAHGRSGDRAASDPRDQRIADLEAAVTQLREGLVTRQRIGAATGLLAGRFGCTPEQAWELLVRISQHTNHKVRAVAGVVLAAHAGQVPDEDADLAALVDAQLPGGLPQPPSTPPQ